MSEEHVHHDADLQPAERAVPMQRHWAWITVGVIHLCIGVLLLVGFVWLMAPWFTTDGGGLNLPKVRTLDEVAVWAALLGWLWHAPLTGLLCLATFFATRVGSRLAVWLTTALGLAACAAHVLLQLHLRDLIQRAQAGQPVNLPDDALIVGANVQVAVIVSALLALPWILALVALLVSWRSKPAGR